MNTRSERGYRYQCAVTWAAIGLWCVPMSWGVPPMELEPVAPPQLLAPGVPDASQNATATARPVPVPAPESAGPGTGADTCDAATPVVVNVGPVGNPNTVTINGDSSAATGPECAGLATSWWEAFEIDTCADVVIDFCGSSPVVQPSYVFVPSLCGVGTCGGFFLWDGSDGNARDECPGFPADTNITMRFSALPAGTYYYPIIADGMSGNIPGPYVMHISAEECTGACCNTSNQTCVEDATEDQCLAAGDAWFPGETCLSSGCQGACCDAVNEVCQDNTFEQDCINAGSDYYSGQSCCTLECRDPLGPEFDASGVKLLSNVPLGDFDSNPSAANEMWGYTSPSGREYAIMGLRCSVAFIEVTDPLNPVIIDEVPGTCSTWRDMAVFGEHAYAVADEVPDGLYVIDLTNIDSGTISFSTTGAGIGFSDAHNVFVNESSGYLYLAIPNTNGGNGLTVLDLNVDPANPTLAGFWTDPDPNVRCHDVQVVTYTAGVNAGREIAFCFAENDGLRIADVTDKANMFRVSSLIYPNTTYAHQGWLGEDTNYIYLGDELDERDNPNVDFTTTYVIDVSDLNNPQLATTVEGPYCAIDHNLTVRGDLLFESNYATGLRVYNIQDVNNIHEVGHFDTHPENNGTNFEGTWGNYPFLPSRVVLLSDRQRGLFVLDVSQIEKEQDFPKFTQAPKGLGEDLTSNVDATDLAPSVVVADDWVSDGRPITAVRWWGSDLSAASKTCDTPFTCGGGAVGCGGNPDCLCFKRPDLSGNCMLVESCQLLTPCPNGDSDCPPDRKCAIDTCCTDVEPFSDAVCLQNCPPPVVVPDGWLVSYHEPLTIGGSPEPPLGLYFCDASAVEQTPTALGACDGHPVIEYFVHLSDCCLVHANSDSRSGLTPATKAAFLEEKCAAYALDIQAVVGQRYEQDPDTLECIAQATGNVASGDFWGWHTTDNERGQEPGVETSVTMSGPDWLYGPWSAVQPVCSQPNMAFELVTSVPNTSNPDNDDNGIPDICECPPADAPLVASPASHAAASKNRYLSIAPRNPGRATALRVTLTASATHPGAVGSQWWVGPPREICENSGQGPAIPPGSCGPAPGVPKRTMWWSELACSQSCLDWPSFIDVAGNPLDVLHISGQDVATGSTYEIQAVDCVCDTGDPASYSAPLPITTGLWGDTTHNPPGACPHAPPNGFPVDLIPDCTSVVQKFSNDPCALLKSRADLEPNTPDLVINITDVAECVNAFSGGGYPYPSPVGCP